MTTTQPFINFSKFNPSKIIKTPFESKTSKPKNDNGQMITQQYYTSSIMYEYDVKDNDGMDCKIVAPLCIEGPELFSPSGILIKTQPSGFDTASIFTKFDLTNTEVANFVDFGDKTTGRPPGFWEAFYRSCLERIWEARGSIPTLARTPSKEAMEGVFPYPIFFMRDPITLQITAGSNPSKYFPVLSYGKPGTYSRKEALFTVPIEEGKIGDTIQYKKLDWKFLTNVEMKFKPLIKFEALFAVGGKVSAKFSIISATVISIVKANTQAAQRETLATYAADRTISSNIAAQVEALIKSFESSNVEQSKQENKDTPQQQSQITSPGGNNLPQQEVFPGLKSSGANPSLQALMGSVKNNE